MPTNTPPADSSAAELLSAVASLRAELEHKDAEIKRLAAELEVVRAESASRWEAIVRLAPTAKRLRVERDQLLEKLKQTET